MKKIQVFIATLLTLASAKAQDFIYVGKDDTKDISAYSGKSIIYTDYVRIIPGSTGFTFTATPGNSFVIKSYATVNNPQSLDKNFVRTEVILTPQTVENNLSALPVEQKTTTYSYVDGVGRELQNVVVGGSPTKSDIISFRAYDATLDRQTFEYLDYTYNTQFGKYHTSPAIEQNSFFTNSAKVAADPEPWKKNLFDNSPSNQVVSSIGAGQDWHTNNKGVVTKIKQNTAGEVQKWDFQGIQLRSGVYTLVPPSATTTHVPLSLLVTETIDENGLLTTRTYKNFKGQVLLERRTDGTTANTFDTYNVYDSTGNLRYVFPPEASDRISEYMGYYNANNLTSARTFLDTWCFQYNYDNYQRLTEKRVPGADWVYTIYNNNDLPVYTQDGKLRVSGQWLFTKYDALNRPIITGIISGLRATLQKQVGGYETRANNSVGYTNVAYPSVSLANMFTITYYDDYFFVNYTGWDAERGNYNFVNESASGYNFPNSGNTDDLFTSIVKGKPTGSKVLVLGSGSTKWLNGVTYYDKKYRVIQTIAENNVGGQDRTTNVYDFAGRTIASLQKHTGTGSVSLFNEFSYDHGSRVTQVYQTIDSGPRVLLAGNKYNELGQLIEKNMHSTDNGSSFLQSVDYRYNIRGWVTSINNSALTNDGAINDDSNDLFGMELFYNKPLSVNNVSSNLLWNGNIGAIKWKNTNLISTAKEKAFRFSYDPFSRLSNSDFATNSNGNFATDAGAYYNSYAYDRNGNMKALVRKGILGGAVQTIDNLNYGYLGGNSNKLAFVNDASSYSTFGSKGIGFTEKTKSTGSEYTYDANGNATQDLNKGMDVTYNHLNMPTLVNFGSGNYIQYTYDALGNKLSQQVYKTNTLTNNRQYVGNVHYEDGVLQFVNINDGRAYNSNGTWQYEYQLRDHQSNVMASFGSLKDALVSKACMETNNSTVKAYEEGPTFININASRRVATFNNTKPTASTPVPNQSILTNGAISGKQIGPGLKKITVNSGDRIVMRVHARYQTPASNPLTAGAIVGSLVNLAISNFGLSGTEATGFNNYLPGARGLGQVTSNGSAPKAYLNYILLNSTYTASTFGFKSVSTKATNGFEKLELTLTVPAGYDGGALYVYTTNESNFNTYFDDFYVLQEKSNSTLQVTQTSDYYPFGVSFNEWNKESIKANRYLYQHQENQDDLDYGEYQYKYRMHDPTMGRFKSVDPLADKYAYNSTYAFSENRVIDGIELEGKEHLPTFDKLQYTDNRLLNAWYVPNNVAIDLVNALPNLWNASVNLDNKIKDIGYSGLYNETSEQMTSFRSSIVPAFQQIVDYHKNTPFNIQVKDAFSSLDNAKNWEAPFSLAVTALTTKNFTSNPFPVASSGRDWLSGGKTFREFKASRGGTETLFHIQTSTGTQRISTEFSHMFITQRVQRAYNLPNWLVNNDLNVWKLNTIQHSLVDSYRFNFLRAGIKPDVGWFGKYNWFTKY